ncbi:general transcription factor IIH [Tieghemostelium lacteum]|uniref:General transcription factor IIH subunit 3 n=1 Tax=Tieghemostelium lacteum TaxID=361077 RepID=A0A152A7Q6_TIELA|nr:general transcription factor IIH [Tieghemostelium lacteum]|eukprot:KYR02238.1 general transcription factor IIH [Tieghemostelium lacteum]
MVIIESTDEEEYDTSLLVIIVDTNIYSWGNRILQMSNKTESTSSTKLGSSLIGFNTFVEHLMVFINLHLMLNQENQIAVISSQIGEARFLFPEPHQSQSTKSEQKSIQNIILGKLLHLDTTIKETNQESTSSNFSAALSLSLCYINRIKKEVPIIRPRIFVLNISPDASSQYISVMNCIFSAQKQSIPLDTCILSQQDSTFLQQASHLTNGIYLKPQRQENLSQYLISTFLMDTYSRKLLQCPTLKSVDYRATCFCHKRIVDIGFVCSVCLSIFCSYSSSCSTCGTKFSLKIEIPKSRKSLSQPSSQEQPTNNKDKVEY